MYPGVNVHSPVTLCDSFQTVHPFNYNRGLANAEKNVWLKTRM